MAEVVPRRVIEEKIVGGFEIGGGTSPYKEVEIVGAPPSGYVPATPATPPKAPSTGKVKRSEFYVAHESILRAIQNAADRGICMTPKEIATKTNIDIDVVNEHLDLLELSKAVKTVQNNENPAVCHIDYLAKKLRELRKL